ncbi:MAG: hypothetical protein LBM13_06095 [Candidatus Ancillula sp.]|jgi:hypothetical protein|nr:hypothetical protein [Candidatus Ancillula sp.]
MLKKRYKILQYDPRSVLDLTKGERDLTEDEFSSIPKSYVPIDSPFQYIPEEEQEYDLVWMKQEEK